ncbi:MAG: TonB-dependent receptor [Ferruginibacter sp.]
MKMKILMMAAVLTSSHIYAQDSTKLLDDVVVTATKYPIKTSLTGKVVTVIGRQELERNSGKTITEILNAQSGLIINGSSNVHGTNRDVYLQGAAAGKTLILIDGVPMYDPSGISGAFDLNFISAEQVERVEILKGSQSTLYGSDAIAGVINIITKKGGDKKFGITADLGAGSHETYKGNIEVGGTINKSAYNFSYNKLYSKGFSSAYDVTGNNHFDKDGFDRDVLRGSVQQTILNNLLIKASGQFSQYKADSDNSSFTDDDDYTLKTKNFSAGFGADYKMGKSVLHLNYNYNRSERNYFDDSIPPIGFDYFSTGKYIGKSHFVEMFGNLVLAKNIDVVAGADYRQQVTDQAYSSVSLFGPFKAELGDSAKVNQLGVFATFIIKDLGGFNVELGGRYNNFSKYGNVFTFSFNPSYVIAKKFKIFGNIASGFKAPSLYQVYSEYRNPYNELDPERSLSVEAGMQYFRENVNVRAVYFLRNVKDNIAFYSAGAPSFASYYINADQQKDKGFEFDATVLVGKVRLIGNYTNLDGYLETKNNNKDTSYFNLYRRPRQTINLDAGIDINKSWSVNIGVQSIGKRKEGVFGGPPVEMPAYYTWNLYSNYAITKNLRVYVDLKNFTDETYFEVLGYNSNRFNFMAGVVLKF